MDGVCKEKIVNLDTIYYNITILACKTHIKYFVGIKGPTVPFNQSINKANPRPERTIEAQASYEKTVCGYHLQSKNPKKDPECE